jgi:ABC-type glycerol-3-phosphate transport system substrate-binding protein
MKKIVRILSLVMSVILLLSVFTACGTNGKKPNKNFKGLYDNESAEARLLFEKRKIEGDANLEVFWFMSEARDDVKDAASMYKDLYGGEISYYFSSWNDRETDLALLNSAKEVPDVLLGFLEYDFPKFIDMGLFGEIGDNDFDFNNQYVDKKSVESFLTADSKKYGIAVKDDPEVLIYNKDYITKLGFETPYELYKKGEWNWESLKKLAKNLSYDSDNDGMLDHYGFNVWSMKSLFVANNTWPLLRENGVPKLNISAKEVTETYQLLYDICNVDKAFSPEVGETAFPAGKVAMYIERPQLIQHFVNNGMNADSIEIAPVPKGPSASDYMSFYSPVTSAISNTCKNKEAALAFIECYISVQAGMLKTGPRESYGYSYTEQQKEIMDVVSKFDTVEIVSTGYGSFNKNLTGIFNDISKGSTVSAAIELYKNKMENDLK